MKSILRQFFVILFSGFLLSRVGFANDGCGPWPPADKTPLDQLKAQISDLGDSVETPRDRQERIAHAEIQEIQSEVRKLRTQISDLADQDCPMPGEDGQEGVHRMPQDSPLNLPDETDAGLVGTPPNKTEQPSLFLLASLPVDLQDDIDSASQDLDSAKSKLRSAQKRWKNRCAEQMSSHAPQAREPGGAGLQGAGLQWAGMGGGYAGMSRVGGVASGGWTPSGFTGGAGVSGAMVGAIPAQGLTPWFPPPISASTCIFRPTAFGQYSSGF